MRQLLNAAQNGDPHAQARLGDHYQQVATRNIEQALKWNLEAARLDDPDAQYNLGIIYREGLGVRQDYAEAARWFRLAAEQKHPKAQVELGIAHILGRGVPQDLAAAEEWIIEPALGGYQRAITLIRGVCEEGLRPDSPVGSIVREMKMCHMWSEPHPHW